MSEPEKCSACGRKLFITIMDFIDESQQAKFDAWLQEQNKIACQKQIEALEKCLQENPGDTWTQSKLEMAKAGHPYYGAIGGGLTYRFTPNSIGMGVSVEHNYTKNEINLSDYENW